MIQFSTPFQNSNFEKVLHWTPRILRKDYAGYFSPTSKISCFLIHYSFLPFFVVYSFHIVDSWPQNYFPNKNALTIDLNIGHNESVWEDLHRTVRENIFSWVSWQLYRICKQLWSQTKSLWVGSWINAGLLWIWSG